MIPSDPRALLADSVDRFTSVMRAHVRTRMILNGLRSQVESIAGRLGRADLVPTLLAGYGGVIETRLADDVWSVGQGKLTVAEFVERHGFHGPNEGNVVGHSWREDPAGGGPHRGGARGQVRSRTASGAGRPRGGAARACGVRTAGRAARVAAAALRRLLQFTGFQVRSVELTKAASSPRSTERGPPQTRSDGSWSRQASSTHPTIPSTSPATNCSAPLPRQRSRTRRLPQAAARRLSRVELPVIFAGMPATGACATTPEATAPCAVRPLGREWSRAPCESCSTPDSDDVLEDGEVLVCKFVDPGWTALVSLAGALVTDIGSPASHGAIVARELGITCVVGTGNGTKAAAHRRRGAGGWFDRRDRRTDPVGRMRRETQ